jgi:phosphoserine phosphatase
MIRNDPARRKFELTCDGWADPVKTTLCRRIRQEGNGSTAVFDLDNTCIRNDIGDAMFLQMIVGMNYCGNLAGFWDLFSDREARNTLRAYWKSHNTEAGRFNLGNIRDWPGHFRDYVALFFMQHQKLIDAGRIKEAYRWSVRLLIGQTENQVRQLTVQVLDQEQRRTGERITLASVNHGKIVVNGPIRVYAEIRELISKLKDAPGWAVYIVSASNQYSVKVVGELLGVDPGNIHGIRLRMQASDPSLFSSEVIPPVTYREGKLQLISDLGLDPVLVAGDSMTDFEMLQASRKVALLIDRDNFPKHRATSAKWLFQPASSLTPQKLV